MMLSVVIPSKQEPYLQQTLDDIERHKVLDTEVLWMEDPGIGQRATTDLLVKQAKGEYIMKVDAHCSFGPGFDRIMLEDIESDVILAPYMLVLDAENWTVRTDKRSSNFYFDRELVMQYGVESKDIICKTMCLQGSCFMLRKDLYWELELGNMPSWGGQGPELGLKGWLSGNRVLTTKNTYYAHMFRTTDADFPYDRGLNPGQQANTYLKDVFLTDKWPKAVHKLEWLVERFNRPGNWTLSPTQGLPNNV